MADGGSWVRVAAPSLAFAALVGCSAPREPIHGQELLAVKEQVARRAAADASSTTAEAQALELATLLSAPLDEVSAVRVALLTNPRLQAAYGQVDVAVAERVQAGLLSNPKLTLGVSMFAAGPEVDAGVSQSVLDLFLRPLREARADAGLSITLARVAREGIALVFDVRRAVAGARAAAEEHALRQEALEVARSIVELMTILHRAGNATDLELAREHAAAAAVRLELAAAESARREATEDLIMRLGVWGESAMIALTEAPLDDAASDVDLDHVERGVIESSLNLAEERALLDLLTQDGALVGLGARFPGLSLGASWRRVPDGTTGVGPGLSLELPILDRGSARVARAAAMLRMQEHYYRAEAIELRSAARRLRDRLVESRERSRFVDQVLAPAVRRVVHEQVLTYNAMQIGAFEVLDARSRELDIASARVATHAGRTIAALDLLELLAGNRNDLRLAGAEHKSTRAVRQDRGDNAEH